MSETVCLLSLAVQSPSTSFSLLRKNMDLRHHDSFVVPSLRTQTLKLVVPQASPRRHDQRGWKRGGGKHALETESLTAFTITVILWEDKVNGRTGGMRREWGREIH